MRPALLLLALLLADVSPKTRRDSSNLRPGHLLVAYDNGVVELDRKRNVVWSFKVDGIRAAQRLANGNTLITNSRVKKVQEITPDGRVVWEVEIDCNNLFHAQRTDDGLTWAATVNKGGGGSTVRAYDKDKNEVRALDKVKWPLTCHVLRDGRVIVNEHSPKLMTEYDKDGKRTWSYQADRQSYGIKRLRNGNTLIGQDTRVIEVNPAGRIVWNIDSPVGKYVYAVKRLRNGNTVIGGLQGDLAEIDREGKTLWTWKHEDWGGGYPGPKSVDVGQ